MYGKAKNTTRGRTYPVSPPVCFQAYVISTYLPSWWLRNRPPLLALGLFRACTVTVGGACRGGVAWISTAIGRACQATSILLSPQPRSLNIRRRLVDRRGSESTQTLHRQTQRPLPPWRWVTTPTTRSWSSGTRRMPAASTWGTCLLQTRTGSPHSGRNTRVFYIRVRAAIGRTVVVGRGREVGVILAEFRYS